jgi:hypothetical protein
VRSTSDASNGRGSGTQSIVANTGLAGDEACATTTPPSAGHNTTAVAAMRTARGAGPVSVAAMQLDAMPFTGVLLLPYVDQQRPARGQATALEGLMGPAGRGVQPQHREHDRLAAS